ncbi:MAG: hypothetical protein N2C12_06815, partial [Planctomycetales bacterium]
MSNPLHEKIEWVRRRAWWTALAYGAGWALALSLIALLALGALDFYLRIDYLPIRILLTLFLLAAIGVAIFRFLLPQLKQRL